MLFYGDHLI